MFAIFFLKIIDVIDTMDIVDIKDIFIVGTYSHFVLVPFVSYSVCGEKPCFSNKIILTFNFSLWVYAAYFLYPQGENIFHKTS